MHVEMCDTEAAKDDSLRNNCCKIMSVYCDKKASGGGGKPIYVQHSEQFLV